MEQTVTQPEIDITVTSIKVPTELWLEFRGQVTTRGRTVNESLPEAIRLWIAAQTQ